VSGAWSERRAEEHLLGLELFGMRFGLDRMQRLMTALGSPQRRFRSVHVVGTNGKSSTVRMAAAILQRHELSVGAYLSPHLATFAERVRIGDADIAPEAFGAAVQRAAHAAEKVERTLAGDEKVTQFELVTAAAYSEMAERGVDVAVVEAGLGGRYDATNVLASEVAVLTNVGLEHTRWLGPTVRDIAREKLAVLQDRSTLVLGEGLHPDAEEEARGAAADHEAALVFAAPYRGPALAARGTFQRRNFGMATVAARALLGSVDAEAVAAAALAVTVPGRFEVVAESPLTVLDGAHNPGGMTALVDALSEVSGDGRRLVAVVSILDDKDAPAMLASLLPRCDAAVFTASANPRALSPATLQSLARQLAPSLEAELEPDPRAAIERARAIAGADGVVCAAGSIYLVADLKRVSGARRASSL
jgi:dihydrofolate synthase/folylpolyglutamate synthase